MNLEIAKIVTNHFQYKGISVELLLGYSGRGMYSKKTAAVSGDFGIEDVWKLVIKYREEIASHVELDSIDLRWDQFGLGAVVY
ncbi:hypothetical protein ND2E_3798 [Colwellia psychrerythraea]|uniref:Uncharacterized protein n=2 Tax=Colwellia psychrerythraea TaxID=28229 RepID=A0A099KI31_COLPS|nr:hypothetical protein ND2E_3798 [Colwellia psychrerythraea]